MIATEHQFPVLLIGIEDRVMPVLQQFLRSMKMTVVNSTDDLRNFRLGDGMYAAIFCGSALAGIAATALGEEINSKCPRTPKYFITLDTSVFHARRLHECGFDEAFLMPYDKSDVKRTIEEKISAETGEKAFYPLKTIEFEVGSRLDFDTYVFLPLNEKYVKFTFAGQAFDEGKIKKLQERQIQSLFIEKRDLERFYRYSARRLRDPGEGEKLSGEERTRRLRSSIRSIFADIFDPTHASAEQAQMVLDICRNVISNYITHGASSDWYQRLLDALGEVGDTYSHAMNVSTYSALFAIAIEDANAMDLAMAGILHDIGMVSLPEAITAKDPQKMTVEERNLYSLHAEKSVAILKSKKVQLPEDVETAILQHHEFHNGKGFPKGLSGDKISRNAQILQFADQFDYYTRFENGYGMSTKDACDEIRKTQAIDPALLDLLLPLLVDNPGAKAIKDSA